MSFGVCLRRSRAGRREKIHCLVSQNYRHSLVSNKLQRAEGYEEVGWYWEDVLHVIRQHTTQYWAVTHISVNTNTSNSSQLIHTKHAGVTIAQAQDTLNILSNMICTTLCASLPYMKLGCSVHFDNLRQLNPDLKCSVLQVSVSWGLEDVHVRSGWLIHLARLQYSHAPPPPQSQKNPCLMVALPPGKFLRVRKVFARVYEIHH